MTGPEMKVSIIIPTYNRAHLVPETINAILNQTVQDFEIIIVDNCSKDDTEDVIKHFNQHDPRIRYFKHPNNGIVAVNRNYGIRQAHGEYIAFCDDDDLWYSTKLEKQLLEFAKDPNIGLVCTNAMEFSQSGNIGILYPHVKEDFFTFRYLMHSNKVISSSVMVRKDVLEHAGVFDENRDLFAIEDYDLWLRIVNHYKIRFLQAPLIKYRVHRAQVSGNSLNQYSLEFYRKRKKLYDKYRTAYPDLVETSLRTFLSYRKILKLQWELAQKKVKIGEIFSLKSVPVIDKFRIIFPTVKKSLINLKKKLSMLIFC